jgi:putative transposase
MTAAGDYRPGRHVVAAPHVDLVLVTNYQQGVPTCKSAPYRIRTHRKHLWSPSQFAASSGGPPHSIIWQHAEQQRVSRG